LEAIEIAGLGIRQQYRAGTTMGTGAPKAHANSVHFCYGCLPEPPVTITILAIILLAIYVAAGSI
jgi:hypothetical protein